MRRGCLEVIKSHVDGPIDGPLATCVVDVEWSTWHGGAGVTVCAVESSRVRTEEGTSRRRG